MNICKQFRCNTCDTIIDCRIGISNREIQPFQFACPKCEGKIAFVLGQPDSELAGATEIKDFKAPFQGDNPFIDLHLDLPVGFGRYKLGDTTFFSALRTIGNESFSHLGSRLDALNKLYTKHEGLKRLITQYKRNDIKAFDKIVNEIGIPNIELKSHKKQDVLAALYSFTSIISSPFTIHEHNKELSEKMPQMLLWLHKEHNDKTVEFVTKITKNHFLKNLHNDCLGLYPKMLSFDLPMRPALFYDYTEVDVISKSPARVSTAEFEDCSNFYKDLAEVFSRQLILVAGLNNLSKRGDYDLFGDSVKLNKKKELIKEYSSLERFAKVDLGNKVTAIDNSFYHIDDNSIDNKLRNGIAHYRYEYIESSQLIKYYPTNEGMNRELYNELYFLEFMRKTLLLFREVHNLNHIIKALLYFGLFALDLDA